MLCCNYNPNGNIIENHLDALKSSLGRYSEQYENLMVVADLNDAVNLECVELFPKVVTEKVLLKCRHVVRIRKNNDVLI